MRFASRKQSALRVERAHLETTTRNFLPLPARHEWGEGHSIKVASSPHPSPPEGRRGRTSAPARRWWYPDAPGEARGSAVTKPVLDAPNALRLVCETLHRLQGDWRTPRCRRETNSYEQRNAV